MAQTPDNTMSQVQGLWKLPAPTTRGPTSTSEQKPLAVLQLTIGMSDNSVLDFPPTVFWDMFSQQFDFNNNEPRSSVVGIVGDLIRGRIEGKSLPLYQSQLFELNIAYILFRCWMSFLLSHLKDVRRRLS
jgi:hypothetical protein